jgi:exosortase/archaeosortase family protein
MNSTAPRCIPFGSLPRLAQAAALGSLAAVAAFSVVAWPLWRHDDNLAHGIFLPFLSGLLLLESRRDPAPRFLAPGAFPLLGGAVLLTGGLASLAVAAMYAAALGWSHAMAGFLAAVALTLLLAATWLGLADRRVRFLPINWAAAVAVLLWLFGSLPPPGTFARLSLALQSEVTAGVMRVLHGLGIAAFQAGNVIELARTSVGVSEACSGVRSLLSCTVAGLFLSGFAVCRPRHRVLVVLVSPAIGLAMNFVRSLLLTLLANRGVDIAGRWHDLTGASIIVGTTILVSAFACWLHRREGPAPTGTTDDAPPSRGPAALSGLVAATLVLVLATAALLTLGHPAARSPGPAAPNLAALLPAAPAGWTVSPAVDLDAFSDVLQTHDLVERVYSAGPGPDDAHLTLYLAYWRPGQASVSLVDLHTPDACWPGAGWEAAAVPRERVALPVADQILPPAECRLFALQGFRTNVWYWHLYGGRPLEIVDPRSATRLLRLAWRYGFGRADDQLFVRVSSNRPWEEIASQPALRQFFVNLQPLGL